MSRVYFRRFGGIREGTESGEGKRKETMLEGNGKCCWKDAAWNAREGNLLTSSFLRADHSFPYLRTLVSLPLFT